jgi:DNA-binding beta-propeller fold protein YncE
MGGIKRILRYSVVFVAIAALFASVAASASAAPLVWALNSSKSSVSTIDGRSGEVVGWPIVVGADPSSIAITPNGARAVVVSFTGENVTIIETKSRTAIKTLGLGSNGESVAISPDGKAAYVTDKSDEEVQVINVEKAEAAGSFKAGPEASTIAFSPDGTRAYVGTASGVVVVNTASEEVIGAPIAVGGFPSSIVFAPDGKTAYVTADGAPKVAVIDTALRAVVGSISPSAEPTNLAMSPNGRKLYILSATAGTLSVAETATGTLTGASILVGGESFEVALGPDGTIAYVAAHGSEQIIRIDTTTGTMLAPIAVAGDGVDRLVVAPDQSPTAVFTPPTAIATFPATFDGSASTDPDGGLISSYDWSVGDGATATGPSVSHTYGLPGTYNAKLSVVDDEGCGEAEVFTGRTAYCSGNPGASVQHQVTVASAPVVCSAKFGVRRLLHNRKNGTVRLQVKLRSAGFLILFGKKVHAVTRKVKKAGPMWLTVHARVELNKRLKRTHHARVRTRITFTPNAGCGYKTVHRSFALLRRKKHHR